MGSESGHCEFTRWDREDRHEVYACSRAAEPVETHNGGTVTTCGYHRPWLLALARVKAESHG